jgi:glycosyltransferase involved in cell wall biosynthesis
MASLLLLTPQLPYPPRQGTSLRNYHIIRGLSRRHEVTLLSFDADETDAASFDELLRHCREVLAVPAPERSTRLRMMRLITDSRPDMAHRLESEQFDSALAEALYGGQGGGKSGPAFDIVQIEGLELARVMPVIRQIEPRSRIVLDEHNAEYALQVRSLEADLRDPARWPASLYSWLQIPRLRSYERWACQASDWVVAVSEPDRDRLAELAPSTPISIVPNSIDITEYFAEPSGDFPEYDLVFTGKMDYRPNVDAVLWFAKEIWPIIVRERPGTSWAIVGQRPHARLRPLNKLESVTVTGRVEQIQPFIAGSAVCIMPFRVGGGTRFKIIEAMAAGKAIVSTGMGAEGFNVTSGKELMIADKAADFAAATLNLLNDPDRRLELGKQAQLTAKAYDWRTVTTLFEDVYAQLTAGDLSRQKGPA